MSQSSHRPTAIVPQSEAEALIVQHALALYRDKKTLADDAPHGQFLNVAEAAICEKAREFTRTSLQAIVLDDTPTKRYGKKVEGAGYHHNPTPGKTDAKLCFGHSWVVVTLVVNHPLFGEVSFPIGGSRSCEIWSRTRRR
jgi:hypothetical protein